MLSRMGMRHVLTMAMLLLAGSSAWAADDGVWSVTKSSGEVWVTTSGAAQVSLKQDETLKAGDTIRTGRNGRVLLMRGEETILISPNSVIGVPAEKKDGISTTILQQAGSILLEVEKRNVKHFEVETPYLAAVVKGTQFSVTVNGNSTTVNVKHGQVEVSDFKSGQIALVLPGQAATSFEHGKGGLSLSGSGTFNPIEQGKPRVPSIERIMVPKGGLPAPRNAGDGKVIHALQHVAPSMGENGAVKRNVVRISNALGEVHVNVHKATNGLAHGAEAGGRARNAAREHSATDKTIWSDGGNKSAVASISGQSANGVDGANGASSGGGSATSAASGGASGGVAAVNGAVNGNGPVNPAVGNTRGLGKALGLGNGNGGIGNLHGNGNLKH
jgi:FecR-like protein